MATGQPQEQDDFATEPQSVDLRDYWSIARRRWRLITVLIVIGVLAGAAYSIDRGHSYAATAEVVVQPVTQGPLNQSTQATSQVNMITEQAIAQSGPVIQQAANTLGVPSSELESEIPGKLSVTVPANTLTTSTMLQISWQANSQGAAQQGADAFASAYLSYRHRELASQIAALEGALQRQASSLRTQIVQISEQLAGADSESTRQALTIRLNQLSSQASTVEAQLAALPTYNDSGGSMVPAVLPDKPSGVGRSALLGIGFILGLLMGLAVAFIRDLLDDRVRDAAQLEQRLDAPVLAVMPSAKPIAVGRRQGRRRRQPATVAIATDRNSLTADAVRVLRATTMAVSSRRNLRALMVIAADTSMSASLVVAELGVALAESGKRVLLVASDTQGSALPQIFDVAGNAGLKEGLVRGGDPDAFTRSPTQASGARLPSEVASRLAVLPSGQPPMYPLSALDSGRMGDALRRQREAYDLVLLDAPTGTGADILALASHVDGVIVLARRAHTHSKDLLTLRHHLSQVGAPVVGGVLISSVSRRTQVRQKSAGSLATADYYSPSIARHASQLETAVSPPAADRFAVAAPEHAEQLKPTSPTTTASLSMVRGDMARTAIRRDGQERPQ